MNLFVYFNILFRQFKNKNNEYWALRKEIEKERCKIPAGLFGCLELVVKHRPRGEDETVQQM